MSLSKNIKHIFKDSIVYGGGQFTVKLLGLISVPIFTRLFEPAVYGTIELLASIIAILIWVVLLGMDASMELTYYEQKEAHARKRIYSTGLYVILISSCFFLTVLLLWPEAISRLLFQNTTNTPIIRIASVLLVMTSLLYYGTYFLRLNFEPVKFVLVTVPLGILGLIMALYFIYFMDQGLYGWYLGKTIASAIALAFCLYWTRRHILLTLDYKLIKSMFVIGFPAMMTAVLLSLLSVIDRFFLLRFMSLHEVGIYAVSWRVANLMGMPTGVFFKTWSPLSLKIFHENEYEETYRFIFKYFTILAGFLALLCTLYSFEIISILAGAKYASAYVAVGPLTLALLASWSYRIVRAGPMLKKRTDIIFILTALGIIFCIVALMVLARLFGIFGAGLSVMISQIFLMVLGCILTHRFLAPFRFELKPVIKFWLILVPLICLAMYLNSLEVISLEMIMVKSLVLGSLFLFAHIACVLKLGEIKQLLFHFKQLVHNKRPPASTDCSAV